MTKFYTNEKNDPARYYMSVTKSDTDNFTIRGEEYLSRMIYVGGAGIIQAVMENDTVVPITMVAGGSIPIAAKRINSSSTTATLIVALF